MSNSRYTYCYILFMKNFILLILLSIAVSSVSQEVMQMHSYSNSIKVFYDNANIRKKADINSEVISVAKAGQQLDFLYYTKPGVVNGTKDYWYQVRINDEVGFIWGNLLVKSEIKSTKNTNRSFLFADSKKGINVKVMEDKKLLKVVSIPYQDTLIFNSAMNLGVTHHSDKKEVFLFYYGDYHDSKTLFYSWDNNEFKNFNKPFEDSSFFKYKRDNVQLITEKLVDFRQEANSSSSVIKVLELGKEVSIVKRRVKRDTIGDLSGLWSKIALGKDTGYVWDPYLSIYNFYCYKVSNLCFVVSELPNYKHSLLAIKDGKMVDTISFNRLSNFNGAHSYGNRGLSTVEDVLGICYSGESCGTAGGDVLIAWNNNQFQFIEKSYGIGDGGLSSNHDLIFPTDQGGKPGVIRLNQSESESIDLFHEKGEKDRYESIYDYDITREFVFENGQLYEVDSEVNRMEKLLSSQFQSHKLSFYTKADYNKDGIEDVILYAIDTAGYMTEEYYEKSNKSLLVIALGNKRGGYKILTYSNKLIYHKENRPLLQIVSTKEGFRLELFYSGYYNEESEQRHFYMDYKYDSKKKDFILTKTEEFYPPSNYSATWSKESHSYYKNQIVFKNSYHPEID